MNDTLSRVKAIQAERGWNFDRSFQYVMSEDNQTGSFGRDPVDKGTTLLAIATDGGTVTKHPKLKQELNKHKALEQGRKSSDVSAHVARLAKIRKLMEADPSLSFDAAFTRVTQEENNPSPAVKTSQSASQGNGKLMLVKGAHAGWAFPIFK